MKIISKNIGYLSNIERYDLCDVFSNSERIKGLIICYALATCKDSKFISLDLRAKHEEIGVVEEWQKKYTANSFESIFASITKFTDTFDTSDFGLWTITILYQKTEITISGEKEKTEIGISYSKEKEVNLFPLLYAVEEKSYEYHTFNEQIVKCVMDKFELKLKAAIKALLKLSRYTDIYNEFVDVISCGKWMDTRMAVSVEGFTAEQLNSSYPLSLLGAYNYLIFLRESPKEALESLKKGLPRK